MNEYDDAYLDLNNGITLCHKCHDKYHSKYGLDCNIKNLLNFKNEIGNPSHEKLIKKHGKACSELKNLKENHNNLIKKHEITCEHKRNLEKKNRKLKRENKKLRKKCVMFILMHSCKKKDVMIMSSDFVIHYL